MKEWSAPYVVKHSHTNLTMEVGKNRHLNDLFELLPIIIDALIWNVSFMMRFP